MSTLASGNFERIWLEPREDADPYIGRQWCQDNQWGEDGVEYVRADLATAPAGLTEWKQSIINVCKGCGSDDLPWGGDKTGWGFIYYFIQHLHTRAITAEAALSPPPSQGEVGT